jgi:hypothetical protein
MIYIFRHFRAYLAFILYFHYDGVKGRLKMNKKPLSEKQTASPSKENKVNKFLIIALFIMTALLFFVAGAFMFWFYQDKLPFKREASPSPSAAASPVTSLPETSPSLMPVATPEPTATPASVEEKSDIELIREALATRHGKSFEETIVNIDEIRLPYANGGVKFEGEMGGAWFLAYKGAEGWLIAEDGNGTITCELVEPYNFPVDMVPECFTRDGHRVVR